MVSISSFRSRSKVEKRLLEEQDFHRKTRNLLIVISLSAVLLILLVIGVAVGVLTPKGRGIGSIGNPTTYTADSSISSVRNVTLSPDSRISGITSLAGSLNVSAHPSPEEVFKLSLQVALTELESLPSLPKRLMSSNDKYNASFDSSDPITLQALHDCRPLLTVAIGQVKDCISLAEVNRFSDTDSIQTWLSTAITDQQTC